MIYIGSIGWEYKDWQESIYKNVPFDKWLLVYCKFFNYLEINKTYNELVDKNYFQNLAKLTERKLKIGFRLNKAVTHLNINKSSISENLVIAENIANQFSDLVSENWFGPIIIDFPFSFYFNKNNFSKVIAICKCFENYKKTIKFSNKE